MNDYLCAVLLNETYLCRCKYNDIIGVGTPQKYLNPCIPAHHVGVFYFKEVNRTGDITVANNLKSVTTGFCQSTAIVQRSRSQGRLSVSTSKANFRRKHGTNDLRSKKRWDGSTQLNIKRIAGDNLNIIIRDKYYSAICSRTHHQL